MQVSRSVNTNLMGLSVAGSLAECRAMGNVTLRAQCYAHEIGLCRESAVLLPEQTVHVVDRAHDLGHGAAQGRAVQEGLLLWAHSP